MNENKSPHYRSDIVEEIEDKYDIDVYEIKYYSKVDGTFVESKKITDENIGFKKWAKSLNEEYEKNGKQ